MAGARSHPVSPARRFSSHPRLKLATPRAWVTTVLAALDEFLLDHAACERKASATALALVSHYPDRRRLVDAMIDLAREELDHFAQVYRHIAQRGLILGPDRKDPYASRLSAQFRKGSDVYFLDRLIAGAIFEARGCERFALLARSLPAGPLQELYGSLAASEARHQGLYLDLAREYFAGETVEKRLDELLDVEAEIVRSLPPRPALH